MNNMLIDIIENGIQKMLTSDININYYIGNKLKNEDIKLKYNIIELYNVCNMYNIIYPEINFNNILFYLTKIN